MKQLLTQTPYPLSVLCAVLDVSRSGYYGWLGRPPSPRRQHDERLKVSIRAIHQASRQSEVAPLSWTPLLVKEGVQKCPAPSRRTRRNFGNSSLSWRTPAELSREFGPRAQSIINWVAADSDQGNQYTSVAFGKRCREMGVQPRMGSVGDAYDNAMAESFFATLECELIDRRSWPTQAQARPQLSTGAGQVQVRCCLSPPPR